MPTFLIWRPGRKPRIGVSASRAVGCLLVLGIVAVVILALVVTATGGSGPWEFLSGAALSGGR